MDVQELGPGRVAGVMSTEMTDAQKSEARRLTARSRKREAQAEQDMLAGLWRFTVLRKEDFDKTGDGAWLYFDEHPGHAQTTTVVLLTGDSALVFRCVEDTDIGALRWMSVEICEPGAPS